MRVAPTALALALVALTLAAAPAAAHANLVSATPAPNSELDPEALPDEVVLQFTEPLDASYSSAELLDEDQVDVAGGPARVSASQEMRLPFPETLPDGIYVLTWRALSTVDGHTTGGAFVYIVGNASVPSNFSDFVQATSGSAEADAGGPVESVGRAAFYAGTLLVTGTAAFVLLFRTLLVDATPRYRKLVKSVTLTGAVIAFTGATTAALAFAARVTGATDPAEWLAGLPGTRVGLLWIARAVATAVAVGAVVATRGWRPHRRLAWSIALAAGVTALLAQAAASHAGAGPLPVLGVAFDFVHLVAAAAWLGGFPPLLLALGRRTGAGMTRTPLAIGFSALATWSIAAVLLTGVALSFSLLENVSNLWLTDWGRALAVKLALFFVLAAMGAFNRFVLLPRIRDRIPGTSRVLARTVAVECVLAVAIVGVVVLLTMSSPPAMGGDAAASTTTGDGILTLTDEGRYGTNFTLRVGPADPLTPGLHLYEVKLRNQTANVTNANVTLLFTYLEQDIGTSTKQLEHVGDGAYRGLSGNLALPGLWRIEVTSRGRPDTFDESVSWDVVVEESGGDAGGGGES